MHKDIFGLIYAAEEDNLNLRDLVRERSVSALPVAGRYRIIDFLLSNMVNTGIRNVGIIPRKNYQSLMDHVGSGKEWDLARKNDGLFILPPYDTYMNTGSYHGMVDAIKGAGPYVNRAKQSYCLITASTILYNENYEKIFKQHISTGADVTIMYHVEPATASPKHMGLVMDEDGRVRSISSLIEGETRNVSMDCVLMSKQLLIALVDRGIREGIYDLIEGVVANSLDTIKVHGYEHKGYVARFDSMRDYFGHNMEFLNPEVQKELFYGENRIFTKVKDGNPTKYCPGGSVVNSLVASGCVIEGEVENCVIFRDVIIHKGVKLRNCIVMQGTEIYENASLDHVILDKKVSVRPGAMLVGHESYPVYIPKGGIV